MSTAAFTTEQSLNGRYVKRLLPTRTMRFVGVVRVLHSQYKNNYWSTSSEGRRGLAGIMWCRNYWCNSRFILYMKTYTCQGDAFVKVFWIMNSTATATPVDCVELHPHVFAVFVASLPRIDKRLLLFHCRHRNTATHWCPYIRFHRRGDWR